MPVKCLNINMYCILLLGCLISHAQCLFQPPIIYLENERIIHSNDNISIRCEGTEPVTWTYPNNTVDESMYSSLTIETSETPNSEYKYGTILTLFNASFVDTGFYICHGIGTHDFNNKARVSKIYLYVEDDEHLSVINTEYETITGVQNTDVILPCRPTSPDVSVDLYMDDEKVVLDTTDETGRYVMYHRHIGYIIQNHEEETASVTIEQKYTCYFFRDGSTFNLTLVNIVYLATNSIAKPNIVDITQGHTVIGGNLMLNCTIKCNVQFTMNWIFPNTISNKNGRITESDVSTLDENSNTFYKHLTIRNVTIEDQGEYKCVVKDISENINNDTIFVRIYDLGEHYINLTEANEVYHLHAKAGDESVQWSIDVAAHPIDNLDLRWFNNKNEEIVSGWTDIKSKKYETKFSNTAALLIIRDVNIYDFGTYTLRVKNDYTEKILRVFLNVTDKPTVLIDNEDYHLINKISTIQCKVAGYPEPTVHWAFKPCLNESCSFQSLNESSNEMNGLQIISNLKLTAKSSGYITCFGKNKLGTDNATVAFYVTDVSNGFSIWADGIITNKTGKELTGIVAVGDDLELSCGASIYNYSSRIKWYKSPNQIITHDQDRHILERSHTEYSNKLVLIIKNVNLSDSGEYICKVDGTSYFKNISINVLAPTKPIIYNKNLLKNTIEMQLPGEVRFECFANGIPKPTVIWYKDNVLVYSNNRTQILEDGQVLHFTSTDEIDEANYACEVSNKIGKDRYETQLVFTNKRTGLVTYYIVLIVGLMVSLVILLIVLILKIRKEKKMNDELKKVGLENFEKGAVDSLNPDLGIDDQAELLPYDKKFEFPRDKLKLGKQLGAGAFGVVMKADAYGIIDEEDCSTVAVKMVKRNADNTYIRALASELKIMVHLGKHLNVVNLLGACTKNVAKRELFLIVEYCRFGNLQNYLLRHRENFVNQIDVAGIIDFSIFCEENYERSMSTSTNRSNSNNFKYPLNPNLKYADLSFPQRSTKDIALSDQDTNCTGKTTYTEVTTLSMSPSATATGPEELITTSNNSSMQPDWRSNYRGDYKAGNVQPICTKDLLSWSFQVARAMEYLASRKVLHGDLAGRNILLADNNVVKVCDFGLAKSMYKNDNYKKKGDGPLPVKWMAVESIRDRVFSTQSDVWSFGIVLWEFFSLAKTPYPGMEADERLYQKLMDGYRMEQPNYSTKEIYRLMTDCWEGTPTHRPNFTRLAERIGFMLDESVKQHYIDLNDPYLVMNAHRLDDGQSDYLAMFTPPNFENLATPQNYLNEYTSQPTTGYMFMKPGQIFSPREMAQTSLQDNNIFNFELNTQHKIRKRQDSESALGTELLPMLQTTSSPAPSPAPMDSYSNPSYLILPPAPIKILQSKDNYVNMSQNKNTNAYAAQNKLNNEQSASEKPYVNNTSRDWGRVN